MTTGPSPNSASAGEGDGEETVTAIRRGRQPLFYGAIVAAVVLIGVLGAVVGHLRSASNGPTLPRVTGIPADVPTPLADLMSLAPLGRGVAPNFTLTDQNGHMLSLQHFKGRTVVLEFMDPHCTDICPLVAQEFLDAQHDLGLDASKVVFMAVNVNRHFTSSEDVDEFTREHRLNTIPTWHFFTGTPSALENVWRNYSVYVADSKSTSDIVHASDVYFIDPQGRERYIATPQADQSSSGTTYLPSGQLTSWGKGIAIVARSLSQ